MFCSIRKYRMDPAQVDELMHRVDEGFAEEIQREPGLWATRCWIVRTGRRHGFDLPRHEAEGSIAVAAAWIRDNLSDVDIERVDALSAR